MDAMSSISGYNSTSANEEPKTLDVVQLVLRVIFLILVFLLGSFLFIRLLTRPTQTYFYTLYGNLTLGTILCCLLIRPATILQEVPSHGPLIKYCGFYLSLFDMETLFLPLAVMMLTIERAILLSRRNNNTLYSEMIPRRARAAMLIIPWASGLMIGLIKTFALFEPIRDDIVATENATAVGNRSRGCFSGLRPGQYHSVEAMLYTFRLALPLLALVGSAIGAAVTVRNLMKSSMHDRPKSMEFNGTTGASLLLLLILHIYLTIIVITTTAIREQTTSKNALTQWLYFSFEALATSLAIVLLPDIRSVLYENRCCRFLCSSCLCLAGKYNISYK